MEYNRSIELFTESKTLTPGGVSSPVRAFEPHPIFVKSGKGSHFTDADNHDFIDLCMAYGPLIVGHAHPEVLDAVKIQLEKGTVYGTPSKIELNLIKKLTENMPCMDMARLCVSGTEATMHAIRLARGFTGKDGFVKINGGFHGAHDAVLVGAGSGSASSVPGSAGVPADAVKNTYSTEYNDSEMLESILSKNDNIGCLIMEPVMGNMGVITPKKGFLEDVRKITKEHDTVLIFDEVICGCRLSEGGAQKMFGVTPDLTTMAKIIGGGFPAGAFGGKRELMENISPAGSVYAAGTFAGNPMSAAAGLATLDIMSRPGTYDLLNSKTAKMASAFRDMLADSNTKACVNSIGSMTSIFFGLDEVTNGTEAAKVDRKMFGRLFKYMLEKGIYLPPSALEVSFTSIVHSDDDIKAIEEAFESFLREVKE